MDSEKVCVILMYYYIINKNIKKSFATNFNYVQNNIFLNLLNYVYLGVLNGKSFIQFNSGAPVADMLIELNVCTFISFHELK